MSPLAYAQSLIEQLTNSGHIAYFAGGSVRDELLGLSPKDYDIATSAKPEEVLKIFPHGDQVGAHFGVIIVASDGHMVEIATFRTDGDYHDGRRPASVQFSSPKNDAQRRDFTINGLFKDAKTGEIIDYVGGKLDIQNRIIRAIGDPQKRFQEDALRLLRAVRFSTVLNFPIEEKTKQAIHDHSHLLSQISLERIRDEFSKIISSSRRRAGLELLVETGLIDHIIPEIKSLIGCEQPPQWHPEGDVYTHTGIMLEMLAEDSPLELCLAVLLHDIAKPPTRTIDTDGRIRFNGHDALGAEMAEHILNRLHYSNAIISKVTHMVGRHMQFMHVQQMRKAKLKRFMAAPEFKHEMELHRVDCASSNGFTDNYLFLEQKAEEFSNEPLIPKPLITGKDLITRSLKPGPLFRELLEEIQNQQLENIITNREQALQLLDSMISSKQD